MDSFLSEKKLHKWDLPDVAEDGYPDSDMRKSQPSTDSEDNISLAAASANIRKSTFSGNLLKVSYEGSIYWKATKCINGKPNYNLVEKKLQTPSITR